MMPDHSIESDSETVLLHQLKESKELLQSVFDTSLIGMSVLKAVRDTNGAIEDFEIKLVNRELERLTGRSDLVSKMYLTEYPGIKEAGLYEVMLEVMDTGLAGHKEYYYQHEGFNRWFSSTFVKVDDGLVASNLDITDKKLAEEELVKKFTILNQSERLSKAGSWEYDLTSGSFSWSEGMYNLFELDHDTNVSPKIYKEFAAKNSTVTANRITNCITSGNEDCDETLTVIINGLEKVLRVKTLVLYDARHVALRVVGVDIDITQNVKLKEEKRKLESNQKNLEAEQKQKMFWAMLTAQEEERRRIAESLHSGLAQLLFGIKFSLHAPGVSKDPNQSLQAKDFTDKLLNDAINECRRISHELTPVVLDTFGLKDAIHEICRQFYPALSIKAEFAGDVKLSKAMEVAIYRTVQELVVNIIKHANATEAEIKISVNKEEVNIIVQDNGVGFSEENKSDGIGIKTIKNKVQLLNGVFEISNGQASGSIIRIIIPLKSAPPIL